MSKGLNNIVSEREQKETVMRRIRNHTGGLGYWAAVDAAKKLNVPVSTKKENE